jgi:succinyl-diaminopimelate desuccinylase
LAWLTSHRDDLVNFLIDLVRIPSDNPPGDCSAIADRVEAEFRRLGVESERHDVPRGAWPPASTVLGWLGPRTLSPVILLNAHADVIPPGEGWTADPYEGAVIDGRIVGRGAAVSKSDVASYTYALAGARELLGAVPSAAVVAITSDEESGGALGPGWLLNAHGLRPQRAICAGSTHSVGVAHNGCVQGRIRIVGRTAHAAMPWEGIDAVRLAHCVLSRLYEEDAALREQPSSIAGIRCPTLTVTKVAGGEMQGVTAGSAEIWFDRRVLPDEDVQAAVERLQFLVASLDAESEGSLEFRPILVAQPLRPAERQAELVELIQHEASRVLGQEVEARGVPIFTDARWFSAVGVPTVIYGAGPADPAEARGHAADENVAIDDLVHATEIVARVLLRLLGERGV